MPSARSFVRALSRCAAVLVCSAGICGPVTPSAATATTPNAAATALLTVRGVVLDAKTRAPVPVASVAPAGAPARNVLTNSSGAFELQVPVTSGAIVVQHIAYATQEVPLTVAARAHITHVEVRLEPQAHVMAAVNVEARSVTPLSSGHTASYTIPSRELRELPLDDALEIVNLLPGVVVAGDRPFFRGLGFEHVVPLIDGMPAREPMYGEWILPPPDGIGSAELVAGSFGVEYGALSGVFNVRMAEGGPTPRARLSYATDRIDVMGSNGTDHAELTAGGPTSVDGLRFAVAWQGRLSDTYLAYDRGNPRLSALGIVDLGDRMRGDQSASVRFTLVPTGESPARATWRASATALHVSDERRDYHHNYALDGWVGYEAEFSRYTTYLTEPDDADSTIWNDAQPRVPVSQRRSTVLMGTYDRTLGDGAVGVNVRYADHSRDTTPRGRHLDDIEAVRDWIRNDVTDEDDQTEWYFATHGDYPYFERSTSRELAVGTRGRIPIGKHDVVAGGGATFARHDFVGLSELDFNGEVVPVGSFDDDLRSFDCFAYLQDTWKTDAFSSVQLGVRLDARRLDGYGGSGSAVALSPRIGFHQPMTDRDALHVYAGNLLQFPNYRVYIPFAIRPEAGFAVTAQRTRAFEVGLQRHVSSRVVAYLSLFLRRSDDVVFSAPEPSELDFLFGARVPAQPEITTRGLELTIDHQLHPTTTGQVSVALGKTTVDDAETAWSRRASVRSRLTFRPDRRVRVTASALWSSGRPYAVCIKDRDCLDAEVHEGRLPHYFSVDARAAWTFGRRGGVRLFTEIRNLFDRRVPTFDFGVTKANVRRDNFIAYYDEVGRPGGYLVDVGQRVHRFDIDNPETQSAGRTLRIGIEVGR